MPSESRSSVSVAISVSSAVAQHVLVGRGDVAPDPGRARGQPGRVVQAGARQLEPRVPGERADDVHQGAGGELRQVADGADEAIVKLGRHDVRHGAQPDDELFEPLERLRRVTRPGASGSRDGRRRGPRAPAPAPPRAAPAMGWPPMNATDGTRSGRGDRRSLGAAGVGHDGRRARRWAGSSASSGDVGEHRAPRARPGPRRRRRARPVARVRSGRSRLPATAGPRPGRSNRRSGRTRRSRRA